MGWNRVKDCVILLWPTYLLTAAAAVLGGEEYKFTNDHFLIAHFQLELSPRRIDGSFQISVAYEAKVKASSGLAYVRLTGARISLECYVSCNEINVFMGFCCLQ